MTSEIISIGDEILIGQIANTNAQWMAQQLNLFGIPVNQITTVGDNREELLNILSAASYRSEIILLTGGLGPTCDDITKQTLCEFFRTKLVFNKKCFEDVKRIFSERNLPMPEINREQAMLPENCIPIRNLHGTAPGMWFEEPVGSKQLTVGNKIQKTDLPTAYLPAGRHGCLPLTCIFVSLPGVPYEMKAMMKDYVLHKLKKRFGKKVIIHKTILTQGIGESALTEKIRHWEDSLSNTAVKLAYLPSPGMVKLRLSAGNKNLSGFINEKINELKKIIPENFIAAEEFGNEPETMEKIIGEMLRKKKKTLAAAESCTGGFISHLLTSIAGSSDYFKGSIIAYSNEVKEKSLGVSSYILNTKGAVSKETAEQMARGVRKQLKSDFGIAATGIAGPSGGSAEKPVGTVWIAVASPDKVISRKFVFGKNRERNIREASLAALNMLRALLKNKF